jgi:hypothetical protein
LDSYDDNVFFFRYPQDSEKDMLAARTGLTRNQVTSSFLPIDSKH